MVTCLLHWLGLLVLRQQGPQVLMTDWHRYQCLHCLQWHLLLQRREPVTSLHLRVLLVKPGSLEVARGWHNHHPLHWHLLLQGRKPVTSLLQHLWILLVQPGSQEAARGWHHRHPWHWHLLMWMVIGA
jgi:hypothetical protein